MNTRKIFDGRCLPTYKSTLVTAISLLLLNACGADGSSARSHRYDQPYKCISEHTSKKSGKSYKTARFYHPDKNWVLALSAVDKNSFIKVANLYASEGRYDGAYKGKYPDIKKLSFATLWPSAKLEPGKINLVGLNKTKAKDCSPMTADESIFSMIDISDTEVMPK